ncbi:phosphotransferase family protein [Actinacidiphila sp. bgisy167]|uniref:phosphotransferase family protein n=1 Tax=Actinacidiphila sp. bgisy167 TaxID=3413797 RepID=UPI003D74BA3C
MAATRPGGFHPSELRALLFHACRTAGLDARGAVLLRGQTNAVFRLAVEPVLVKIARYGTPIVDVQHTVELVRWLMATGFPTAPLHPVPQQPVVVHGHAATFWTYLPQPGTAVPAEGLAKPLGTLHTAPPPPVPLRRLDAITAIRASLAQTSVLPASAVEFLNAQADRLETELAHVTYELPEALLHGDPQHGNALHAHGGPVLCDWDSAVIGPPEWDLVTVEVHCRRFGYGTDHYRRFADTYGWDVTAWSGYRLLRDLRELRMITTNARKAIHAPQSVDEVQRRVAALQRADTGSRWNIL